MDGNKDVGYSSSGCMDWILMKVTIYGEGGFDQTKPNNNILEQYEVADPEPSPSELARISAMEKLTALGLTEDEINALLGR